MSMTNEHKLQVLKKVGEELSLPYMETTGGRHRWFLPFEEQSYDTCIMEMNGGSITIPTGVYISSFFDNKIGFASRRGCCLTFNSIDQLKARLDDALRFWKEAKVKLKVKQIEEDFEDGIG